MESRWSDSQAKALADKYGEDHELSLRTYSSRLLGREPSLVLHGGGNTSVKGHAVDVFGERVPAIFVKASGQDLATIEPEGHPPLDLAYMRRLRVLGDLSDVQMRNEIRTHLFRAEDRTPSIEALVHAFLPPRFIDHTHADAILALTNREGGAQVVRDALGNQVIVLPYVRPGFQLAKAAADAFDANPGACAMVWMHHGLLTWGDSARESYERTIDLVSRAERFLAESATRRVTAAAGTPTSGVAAERLGSVAPIVRGVLGRASLNRGGALRRAVLRALADDRLLGWLDQPGARDLFVSPPLTSDHLIRTKAFPLWIEAPDFAHPDRLRDQVANAVSRYVGEYDAYVDRNRGTIPPGMKAFDPCPRVLMLPGAGALCVGPDLDAATVAADITAHTLAVKMQIWAGGGRYEGLDEREFVEMEYHVLQAAKLADRPGALHGHVALVTGAAGAIGAGICRTLLAHGCLVVVTDLPGDPLDSLAAELDAVAGARVLAVPMDVTDPQSVAQGFAAASMQWGGVDIVIVNAGIAHVSPLDAMDLEAFRRLERVNIEGTLLLLAEAGRHFRHQGTGGDVVLVSTKNVFAPGAKFGAYSATKAASHQLARIASLELADIDVRVNMVSPDAVFGDAGRKSGLWKAVGPDRMRARGLDEAGLEEYYRSRNLLKTRVTAEHVANAVMFFVTRQTPTTGATLPVDGGLPDATPR
jgi:rhamnose utilization protein RhaD (predicted bifunctional aldolase and dehydrogenase)/NAD(P)-dependent dehydrogenase (short-subunit alcohol dehydrogenase family)